MSRGSTPRFLAFLFTGLRRIQPCPLLSCFRKTLSILPVERDGSGKHFSSLKFGEGDNIAQLQTWHAHIWLANPDGFFSVPEQRREKAMSPANSRASPTLLIYLLNQILLCCISSSTHILHTRQHGQGCLKFFYLHAMLYSPSTKPRLRIGVKVVFFFLPRSNKRVEPFWFQIHSHVSTKTRFVLMVC